MITGLAGCGVLLGSGEKDAEDFVVRLLRTTAMNSYTADIDDFARAAVNASGPVQLIGIGRADPDEMEVLGTLTFMVLLPEDKNPPPFAPSESERDRGPYCYEVVFDQYGAHGEFGTADGMTHIDCPEDAAPLTPPASDLPVVADNAREAAHEVLAGLPASGLPSTDEIADQVTALLDDAPVGGPPVAEVSVAIDGADVGVAMGGADDCVLVARRNGEVVDVHAPSVYLQVGELGCRPYTALSDDLRPPH